MASLRRIQEKKHTIRVGGRTYHYGPRTYWRVVYRIWLPDGRVVEKTKARKKKSHAVLLLAEAEKLEARSQRSIMPLDEVRRLYAIGLLDEEEARAFLGYSPKLSWENLLDEYEMLSSRNCRPDTHRKNMSRARKMVSFFQQMGLPPDMVTAQEVERWKSAWQDLGLSNKTINIDLDILRQMLDPVWGKRNNPAREVGKMSIAKMGRLPRALTPEEDEQAMSLAWENRHKLEGLLWHMYLVFRFAGLRRSEARFLPWKHILEDRILVQEVELDSQEIPAGDRLRGNIWRPKEGEARAVVTIPSWVLEELRKLPQRGKLVFAPGGKALNKDVVGQTFKKILSQVSPDLTLHDLRHTYITELMEKGVPPAKVQRLAGHKLLSTTERYTHVAVEGRVRDLEQIYRRLIGKQKESTSAADPAG
ncbi:MAG: site-specific integrase [Armatimonadota bacterium]|nr:site-specific integrase [Armatimonadota bacterium]